MYQILDVERRNITLKPFVDDEDKEHMSSLYLATVQPFDIWGPIPSPDHDDQQCLEAFVIEEPCKLDVISLFGADLLLWRQLRVWKSKESDVEGCITLYGSSPLAARKFSVLDSTIPVLMLIDLLQEAGFEPVEEALVHTPDSRLAFDRRSPASRRLYYQCLLVRATLWEKGVVDIHSNGSQADFKALVGCRRPVRHGLKAADYRKMLAESEGDVVALALQGRKRARPPALEAVGRPPIAPRSPSVCSSIAGDAAPMEDVGAEGVLAPAPAAAPHAEVEVYKPEQILGVAVGLTKGRRTATHVYEPRLRIVCNHHGCNRSRSVVMLADRFGPRCAEAFLGAWLAKGAALSGAEHKGFDPSLADMEEYLNNHPV